MYHNTVLHFVEAAQGSEAFPIITILPHRRIPSRLQHVIPPMERHTIGELNGKHRICVNDRNSTGDVSRHHPTPIKRPCPFRL